MATFYTGVDQERYDAGEKFLPQNRFLLNYTTPTTNTEEEEVTTSYGIPNTNAFINAGGAVGGNNYRTDYRPNYEYRQYVDGYDPNLTATMNMKMMEVDPNYKGADYYNKPAPSGIQKMLGTAINYIPYIGPMKRGAEFLGDTLGKYIPANQRAILENELRGTGVYTDDIGRIVAGPDGYNTAEGIMAGYNAYHMDPTKENNAWDRRTETITETLGSKYGITNKDHIQGIIDGTFTDEDVEKEYGIKTNLTSNLYNINLNKLNFQKTKQKADDIYEWEKQQKEDAKTKTKTKTKTTTTDQNQTGGGDGYTGDPTGDHAGIDYSGANYGPHKDSWSGGSGNQGTTPGAGLHADYNQGGRVGLRYGGLLSIL
jgi:hypothetical protein